MAGDLRNWLTRGGKAAALAALVAAFAAAVQAEESIFRSWGQSTAQEESALTATLQSDAPLADKMLACKRLAIVGDERAVPVLAGLLADAKLAHMARHALETIPGAAADEALVSALGTTSGRQLVGVINSIGVRRNAAAVSTLGELLKGDNDDVAAAAGGALAAIGNSEAAGRLLAAIEGSTGDRRVALDDAGLRCAERLAAEKQLDAANTLYETLAAKTTRRPVRLAAALGLLRIAPDAEFPGRLAAWLRSSDEVEREAAIGAAHERRGQAVTSALAGALGGASAEQQVRLLEALAQQGAGDAAVVAKVAEVAKTSAPGVRVAALRCLGRVGDRTVVPLLVASAAEGDAAVSATSAASLEALAGEGVDAAVLDQLAGSDGARRRVVVDVIGRRGIAAAGPALFKLLTLDDHSLRLAALAALSQVVDPAGLAMLVDRVPATKEAEERKALLAAVDAACRRMPDAEAVVAIVVERQQTWPADQQPVLLEMLGAVGGKSALGIVASSAEADSPELVNAATRVLGQWMTPDAAPVLLRIAGSDHRYKVRALRGYLRIARQLNLPPEERLAMCREALRVVERPEERELVLEVLTRCPSPAAIELAEGLLADGVVRAKAAETLVVLAERIKEENPSAASAAAQRALAAGLVDGFEQRAQRLVKQN